MAVLSGVPADTAISWVRTNYSVYAVEETEQEKWVRDFAARVKEGPTRTIRVEEFNLLGIQDPLVAD